MLDLMMRVSPPAQSEVVIVEITDDDYKNHFHAKSPLDAAQLQRLIEAVAAYQPKLIGVDIDTSDEQFKNLYIAEHLREKIVWVSEPKIFKNEKGEDEIFEVKNALAGRATKENSALPLLLDDKKVTRRYRRFIEAGEDYLPSFSWAIARRFPTNEVKKVIEQCDKNKKECADDLLIGYASENSSRNKISASEALDGKLQEKPIEENLIKDKIVLIGGSYLGQDIHETPLGEMTGVETLANAIKAELGGRVIEPPSCYVLFLLAFLSQILLVVLFYKFPFGKALLLSFTIFLLSALLLSAVYANAINTYAQWAYFSAFFVPISLGLLFSSLVDRLGDLRKEKLKKFITSLPKEL